MSKRAQADIVVPRTSLGNPAERQAIRQALYGALTKLGHVESIVRYVADPPDGPFRESAHADLDLDKHAIVRVIARVVPFS